MTETVVTDNHQTVVVDTSRPQVIVTGIMGPAGTGNMSELQDVNLTELTNGSMLVYNSTVNKWAATTLLNQQVVDCGQF